MLARIGVLLALLTPAAALAGEPQEDVMLHAYARDGTFHYAPARVEVLPNASVVLGHLFGDHSLTSTDGLFNATGNASRWPAIVAPSDPGTYRFYCWLHATAATSPESGMAGDLVVVAPSSGKAGPPEPVRDASGLPGPALAGILAGALAAVRRRRHRWRAIRPAGET